MKQSVALLLILVLTFSSIVSVLPVKAEYNGDITINTDGSVNPSTAPLKQAGNVYSLTAETSGTITVKNNNTVLEGNSHTLTSPPIFGYGLKLDSVSNVTVANFIITGGAIGININGTLNTVINNTIRDTDNGIYAMQDPTAAIALHDSRSNIITGNALENNTVGIILVSWHPKQCKNNLIVENNFKDSSTAILIYDSSNNSIYHNNFFNNKIILQDTGYSGYSLPSFNIWDDGHQFGNYWSDYLMRYPNATEKGNSGVGDTPYFVKPNNYVNISTLTRQEAKDHWTQINAQYANNTDQYPLMQPFIIAPSTIELFLTTLVIISIVSVVVFAVFLFYFKKRKH
jgi:parallel beta-helix repeat protein